MYKAWISMLCGVALLCGAQAGAQTIRSAADAFPETLDPFTGDYAGRWSEDEDVDPAIYAQVIPHGRDRYRVIVLPCYHNRCRPHFDTEVRARGEVLEFEVPGYFGKIENGVFSGGRGRGNVTFEMNKITRESPALGAAPPEDAIVLFDGTTLDHWENTEDWEITPEGYMLVLPTAGDVRSKQHFGDLRMHIEFRLPYLPNFRGQQRGNSGVFFQDTYEIQVLDSYGLEGFYDECGALYKVAAPMVNACAPPLQWQTYEIEFRVARFGDNGEVAEYPRISVRHNGVLIHHEQEMRWLTAWRERDRLQPPPADPGPIRLQAHNNYVQFRNIWVQPLGPGE